MESCDINCHCSCHDEYYENMYSYNIKEVGILNTFHLKKLAPKIKYIIQWVKGGYFVQIQHKLQTTIGQHIHDHRPFKGSSSFSGTPVVSGSNVDPAKGCHVLPLLLRSSSGGWYLQMSRYLQLSKVFIFIKLFIHLFILSNQYIGFNNNAKPRDSGNWEIFKINLQPRDFYLHHVTISK